MRDFDITGELNVADVLKEQHKEKHKQEQEKQQRITVLEKKAAESFTEHFHKNQLLQFFKKYSTVICILLILLAVLIPRLYIASIPITTTWAATVAETDIKQQATAEINQKYPFLSEIKRNELIAEQTKQQLKQPITKQNIKQFAKQLSDNFKDPEGNVYLYEADPYYYLRAVEQKLFDLDSGFVVIAKLWSTIFLWLSPSSSLMFVLGYLPVAGIIITAILLFFFVRKLAATPVALLASLFFVLHPTVLAQSMYGLVDKQTINSVLMLTILISIFTLYQTYKAKQYAQVVIWFTLTLAAFWLFSTVWRGYVILIGVLVGGMLLFFMTQVLKYRQQQLRMQKGFVFWILAVLLLSIPLFFFAEDKLIGYSHPTVQKYLNTVSVDKYGGSYFPNAFHSIEELQKTTLPQLIALLGGSFFVMLSMVGVIKSVYTMKSEKQNEYILSYAILMVWLSLLILISIQAKRFLFYALLPYIFFLAIGLTSSINAVYHLMKPYIPEKRFFFHCLCLGIAGMIFLIPGIYTAIPFYEKAVVVAPIVDDSFYQAAQVVKQQSTPDAIINAWWDKGHAVQALTGREAYIAASPSMPMTYWIAKSMVDTNENRSKNIQLFLNCRHNPEQWYFKDFFNITSAAERDDYLAFSSDEERIIYLKEKGFNKDKAQENAKRLQCDKKETYILLTEDLLAGFNGVVAMADWDFEAAEAREKINGMDYGQAIDTLKQQYNFTNKEAQELYQRTATLGVIYNLGLQRTQCSQGVELAQCNVLNKVTFLINHTSAEILSSQKPSRFFLAQNDTVIEKHYDDAAYNSTLIVYELDDIYYSIITDHRIADTMFIRLLLLEGYGLEHFKQLADIHSIGTKRTVVYEVEFE